jgi:hypothetical protein
MSRCKSRIDLLKDTSRNSVLLQPLMVKYLLTNQLEIYARLKSSLSRNELSATNPLLNKLPCHFSNTFSSRLLFCRKNNYVLLRHIFFVLTAFF